MSARERLESWIDEYQMCLKYCGLTDEEAVCFNHQIKKCNGICAGEEEHSFYNHRAKTIVQRYSFSNDNFLIMDRGRNQNERSLILIENSRYAGYGYLDQSEQIGSEEELASLVQKKNSFPDANDLVKSWMQKNERCKVVGLRNVSVPSL
jgi:DNA polymerase-3 subunit epsilon